MLRFCLYVFTILFFENLAQAQATDSVKISGVVSSVDSGVVLNTPGTSIYLVGYKEGSGYLSARVQSNGTFSFVVHINQPTFYELKYRDYKMETLISPTEHEYKIEIKADSEEVRAMKVVGSHEYDAYRTFKRIDKNFKDKLPALLAACKGKGKEGVNQLKKELDDFNASLEYLRQAYKATFAAEVLAVMDELPEINTAKPALPQLRDHFFDNTDLSDTKVYTTPDIDRNLSVYIENIADTSAKGRMDFINALYDKTKNNHNGQKEFISLLLGNFIDKNRENYLWSLSHWADSQPKLAEEQPVMAGKFKMLEKAIPGVSASEVSGMDINNEEQKLSAVTKKSKLTLLIFWASDCPHCRHTMPDIAKLYAQYHPLGLEIFAVSIDSDKEKWKQYLNEKKFGWVNVLLDLRDPAPTNYFLSFTPTFALINQNGIILHRFMSLDDFTRSIAEILKK